MRILILAPEPPGRGILLSLAALGVAPVVALARGESATDGPLRYERVMARGDVTDPINLRWSRRALRTLVRDLRPDLIHLVGDPWTPTAEAGAAAARDLKIPYVLVGSSSVGGPRGLTARWQARRIREGAVAVAAPVRSALDHLRREAPEMIGAVLPTGGVEIPVALEARESSRLLTLGVVGRLLPERGLDLLLDALSDTHGAWQLKIVGSGPDQERIEAQAQRLGLSSRIEWLGGLPRSEFARIWHEIDVLAVPSRSTPTWVEPTGAVVVHAMAHGVPAIVSRSGALPDVVGDAGLIFDEGDRTGLARALQGLIEAPERCRTLGQAARNRILDRHGDGPVAEQMVSLWRRALGRDGAVTVQAASP